MLLAAELRGSFVPILLCRAYARGLAEQAGIPIEEAVLIIAKVEKEFRESMMIYGGILIREDIDEIKSLMIDFGAEFAETMLEKQYGITVIESPHGLMEFCLDTALGLVEGDYLDEIDATLDHVDEQLKAHGIETCHW